MARLYHQLAIYSLKVDMVECEHIQSIIGYHFYERKIIDYNNKFI